MANAKVDFSVIVVHHNAKEDLARCLSSLAKSGDGVKHEVIVVDNASSEDIESLRKEFRKVQWIGNDENAGWGRANNLGAGHARGDVLVFLNPDAELFPSSLDMLRKFLSDRKTERIGPVGGKLLHANGEIQDSCGPFPSLANLIWRRALPKAKRRYYLRRPGSFPQAVDWVTGAFMAVRRSVFDELGGFDPNFFLYYEDVDFCFRAKELGYQPYFAPEAVAYHSRPYAVRRNPDPKLKRIIQESRLLYFTKHRPAWEGRLLSKLRGFEKT